MNEKRIRVVTGAKGILPVFEKVYQTFIVFVCDGACNDNPDCCHVFNWSCPGCGVKVKTNGANMQMVKDFREGKCDDCFLRGDKTEPDELTKDQLARQDCVDNAIFQLVNDLVPKHYKKTTNDDPERSLDWNIQWISEIRELAQEIIAEHLDVRAPEREDFEMDFYPYVELAD